MELFGRFTQRFWLRLIGSFRWTWRSCISYSYGWWFRNLAGHLGCIKPCKEFDIYHINWCRISSINRIIQPSSKLCCESTSGLWMSSHPKPSFGAWFENRWTKLVFISTPKDPWDWYIYLHLVDFYGELVGKYTSPMDPMETKHSIHGAFGDEDIHIELHWPADPRRDGDWEFVMAICYLFLWNFIIFVPWFSLSFWKVFLKKPH